MSILWIFLWEARLDVIWQLYYLSLKHGQSLLFFRQKQDTLLYLNNPLPVVTNCWTDNVPLRMGILFGIALLILSISEIRYNFTLVMSFSCLKKSLTSAMLFSIPPTPLAAAVPLPDSKQFCVLYWNLNLSTCLLNR